MSALAWLACVLGPPIAIGLAARSRIAPERLRSVAVFAAALSFGFALLALVPSVVGDARIDGPRWLGDDPLFALRDLSRPLVALPAVLWLVTVAATPRARLDKPGIGRTAWATALVTIAFLTTDPTLLVILWAVSNEVFLGGLTSSEHRSVKRTSAIYLRASVVLLAAGVACRAFGSGAIADWIGPLLILVAVLIRKGIFPFHAWIPDALDRGRIGPTVLFCAPQLGTYVAAVLLLPHAPPALLRVGSILALWTAVYAAALALVQHDARRASGYLFVSQSALVFAGLGCASAEALAGGLTVWLSSALAFTGMGRTILSLEVRRGRLDLRTHHGGYESMPVLGVGFLVLSLACVGFPGTLGFVGEEMLLDGLVRESPALGLGVAVASAFTGLAVLRMYFSLFCGARSTDTSLGTRPREAIMIGALSVALIVFGVFPGWIVDSRYRAAEALARTTSASP
ncbi:MAG: proton-conducting transporter membrane subunit [Sandaracinaceae bacterium]